MNLCEHVCGQFERHLRHVSAEVEASFFVSIATPVQQGGGLAGSIHVIHSCFSQYHFLAAA
jgi:hypothetical protein